MISLTFGEENRMFGGGGSELVVECVMPYFGHIFPIFNHAILDRLCQLHVSLLGIGLFTDEKVFGVCINHDLLVDGINYGILVL
jgi:hypothetical protein